MWKAKRVAIKCIEIACYTTAVLVTVALIISGPVYAYSTRGVIFGGGFVTGFFFGFGVMFLLFVGAFMVATITAFKEHDIEHGRI